MSVPLDRLYYFINNIVDEDIVIYRWYPNGSKNLEDLHVLKINPHYDDNIKLITETPIMICHDQEPLFFDLYSQEQFLHCYTRRLPADYVDSIINHPDTMAYVQHLNIRSALIIPSGFDRDLLLHSELQSKQLSLYEQHGLLGVYYWSHALIARDWFRFAEHDLKIKCYADDYLFDFLLYNRAWTGTREYRLKLTELIVEHDLTSSCNMRFSTQNQSIDYRNHQFVNQRLQIVRRDLHLCFLENKTAPSASADYDSDDYQTCAIEVVAETLFDDSRLHLTEKSLRPIACAKPFILAGTAGSLDYLRSYGFQTFHPYINESYDKEKDPAKRLEMIVVEMLRIKRMNKLQKQDLWNTCKSIALFNQKYFFSDMFHTRVVNELQTNYHRAMQTCRLYHHKNDLRQWLSIYEQALNERFDSYWRKQALSFLGTDSQDRIPV